VQLALSTLKEPGDKGLFLDWAVDLLQHNSTGVPLNDALVAQLKSGQTILGPGLIRYYILTSVSPTVAAPTAIKGLVMVGPVSVPSSVARPQFVIGIAPNSVKVDDFNRWLAPLDDSIAHAVAGNLTALLGPDVQVVTAPKTNNVTAPGTNYSNPQYQITIDVQRFESILGKAALVEAQWSVREEGGYTLRGKTVAREDALGQGFDELAGALSRALAAISGDIAPVIRSNAVKKPVASRHG
jgi:uncharacterized lipoprotein YmbA